MAFRSRTPRSAPTTMRCTPFESGLAEVERSLGADYPALVDGAPRPGQSSFEERSPIDIDLVIGTFADLLQPTSKTPSARRAAAALGGDTVAGAGGAARQGADLISERRNRIAALLTLEVGKNRLESLATSRRPPTSFATTPISWPNTTACAADGTPEPGRGQPT